MTVETQRPQGGNRVVITGMGAVTPAGVGVEALWDALMEKRCCIDHITHFDTTGFEIDIAAEVKDFEPTEHGLTKKEARRFERFVQYAVVAADEAIAQAQIEFSEEDPYRCACIVGTGIGGIDELDRGFRALYERGPKRVSPLLIPTMIANIAAGNIAIRYNLKGECTCVVTACASSSHSIGEGVRAIRHGYADVAVVGGTEECVSPICLAGFTNLGALSKSHDPKEASLPFDVRRSGFVTAEGAGILVIESLEHALARGASIIAEITGFGSTGDAYHVTAPDPSGEPMVRCMRQALDEGGFAPADIGHLNAHGTATPFNDKAEAGALLALCGDEVGKQIPVVAIKGAVGHMLGGAGAGGVITCALSVARDVILPTTGFAEPDPECPVNVLTEPLEHVHQKVALANALGFGGHNATIAISPYEGR